VALALVITVVITALVYAFVNGFHDAADSVATAVATRALTPRIALALAALMNLVGAIAGHRIAETVTDTLTLDRGFGNDALVIVLAALVAATGWNVFTWYLGLPSSSVHALVGALVGAGLVAGVSVHLGTVIHQVLLPALLVPFAAFALGYALMVLLVRCLRGTTPGRAGKSLRLAQTVAAAAMALGHGIQAGARTMGVVFFALLVGNYADVGDSLPAWTVIGTAVALAAGTYSGGWRIIRTVGRRIIDLDPAQGLAAEVAAVIVFNVTAYAAQVPPASQHMVTSAVAGVGTTRRLSAVRWVVLRGVALAWLLTVPVAGLAGAVVYAVLHGVLQLP
jgi:PiT family inorganic phosphate transporter